MDYLQRIVNIIALIAPIILMYQLVRVFQLRRQIEAKLKELEEIKAQALTKLQQIAGTTIPLDVILCDQTLIDRHQRN